MTTATKKAEAPTKGVKPDMRGVPGVMVDAVPDGLLFGAKNKVSPYDVLLRQLAAAGTGKFLKFESLRARASVYMRARKLGIKVMFGKDGDTLYVMLAKPKLVEDGVVEKRPDPPTNKQRILQAIKDKRCTPGEIVTWLRSNGEPGISITQVEDLLSVMTRARLVRNISGTRYEMPRYAIL